MWSSLMFPLRPRRSSTGFTPRSFWPRSSVCWRRDGVVGFALGQYENYVSPELARMLSSACLAAKQSFRNVLAIPGRPGVLPRLGRAALRGHRRAHRAAPHQDQAGQPPLPRRHADADRMADLASATAQPAAMNRDFSPVLYYYHLRHWMSQFNVQFGVIQVGLLVVLGLLPGAACAAARLCCLLRALRPPRWRWFCCWPSRSCAARSITRWASS